MRRWQKGQKKLAQNGARSARAAPIEWRFSDQLEPTTTTIIIRTTTTAQNIKQREGEREQHFNEQPNNENEDGEEAKVN